MREERGGFYGGPKDSYPMVRVVLRYKVVVVMHEVRSFIYYAIRWAGNFSGLGSDSFSVISC